MGLVTKEYGVRQRRQKVKVEKIREKSKDTPPRAMEKGRKGD